VSSKISHEPGRIEGGVKKGIFLATGGFLRARCRWKLVVVYPIIEPSETSEGEEADIHVAKSPHQLELSHPSFASGGQFRNKKKGRGKSRRQKKI